MSRPIVIRGWIVAYASMIHLTWAMILLVEPTAVHVAPVSRIADFFHENSWWTSLVFFIAGALAWIGAKLRRCNVWALFMGAPQMILIFIGAGECINIALDGVHPDGTIHTTAFFLAQLAGSILLAPVYMLATYYPYWKAIWTSLRSE